MPLVSVFNLRREDRLPELEEATRAALTGHTYYVAGTTMPSNHAFGRAVDISVIDGGAVSFYNRAAREAMQLILRLQPPLIPDELGGPWLLYHAGLRAFRRDHHDHIHIGWDG
jgi:hypothetical protein